ncbi:MAG: 50S ribosomal protein L35 [Candidatus Roizmanbacteria bacterium]|nr:50S ribosomal protein L35 [Candidatus Roizmanbacteria bacterium]
MPKQKTRKSVASRFKLTKTGKLLHRAQNGRHLKRKKSASQKRRMKLMKETTGTLKNKIKKMI